MNENDLYEKAQALMNAAQEYWECCKKQGSNGAVRWLEDDQGRIVIFTRGEYKQELFNNIFTLIEKNKSISFTSDIVVDGDEDE